MGNRFFSFLLCMGLTTCIWGKSLEWISRSHNPERISKGESRRPALSGDGRFVVFQSDQRLLPADRDSHFDIYLFDRQEQKLQLIEVPESNDESGTPAISGNGRMIVYYSYPPSVRKGVPPRISELIQYDRKTDRYEVITNHSYRRPQDGENMDVQLSAKGDVVVFTTNATNLLETMKSPIRSVVAYRAREKAFELISLAADGTPANRASMQPRLSQNRRFVIFKSAAVNLIPPLPDTSLAYHLYHYDRKKDSFFRIDSEAYGFQPEEWNIGHISMDADGAVVAFDAWPRTGVDPVGALDYSDIFLFEKRKKRVRCISQGLFPGRSHSPVLSGDGRYLAFVFDGFNMEDKGGIIVIDRRSDKVHRLYDNTCKQLVFSQNGRTLAMVTNDSRWNPQGNPGSQVYVFSNPLWP